MDSDQFYTTAPVKASEPINIKPEFIRLPRPGAQCPWTGLSRGKLNQLVLPCKENGFNPQRGVRLVFFDSLMDYLKSCETD